MNESSRLYWRIEKQWLRSHPLSWWIINVYIYIYFPCTSMWVWFQWIFASNSKHWKIPEASSSEGEEKVIFEKWCSSLLNFNTIFEWLKGENRRISMHHSRMIFFLLYIKKKKVVWCANISFNVVYWLLKHEHHFIIIGWEHQHSCICCINILLCTLLEDKR